MSGYCSAAPGHEWHGPYHDTEYGFPIESDDVLFERLVLEINQAGLSWLTILKKRDGFRRALADFSIDRVAAFGEDDRARLLADASIIRNRLKVNAAIENARRIQVLQRLHGSFKAWLDAHHPLDRGGWTRLFKKTFLFTGGEIVNEFVQSTGYIEGSHSIDCPIYAKVLVARPPWVATRFGDAGVPRF